MMRTAYAAGLALAVWTLSLPARAEKFALAMFHFNVQYVCGGTIGFLPTANELDLDNDTIEDRIITESLAPVIDLYAKHATWGVDLEMQGYLLDVMAARHPALLAKLRALAKAGQVDVVSFHYSDQLFIGYPEIDWIRSQELTKDTFARHDVPLSRTVFCQEGQAAPRMATRMKERGYRNMVWPKNLWIYQHGDFEAEPLYRFGEVTMIAGAKGVKKQIGNETIEVAWTFFDDGELLATDKANPYFPEIFKHKPASVAAYEKNLEELEKQGYRITTVDKYVDATLAKTTPVDPPPLLDGTWQPNSTNGVKRWLGGQGIWLNQERDNHVRTLGATVHRELIAAETVAKKAGIDSKEKLDAAWRLMFLGQVTDASGINPFRGEIQYGISHLAESLRIAREVIVDAKRALGMDAVVIDPAAGTVVAGDGDPLVATGTPRAAAVAIAVEGDRAVSQSWVDLAPGHSRVALTIAAAESSKVGIRFPGVVDKSLGVSLALGDDQTPGLDRAAFAFQKFHFALPTGWIGLGGGKFVVKDMGQIHLAAEITAKSGDVLFEDQTLAPDESQTWVFHVLEGTAKDAAALAIALNAKRRLAR